MEALGGSLVLANSSVLGEHEESRLFGVADGEETDADIVAGCSFELDVRAQASDVPHGLDDVLPQMVIQVVEKQAKVVDSIPLGNGMELAEMPDPLGGNGVSPGLASSTLLDGYLSSFCCSELLSLLEAPILVQLDGDSTCAGRRSGRLEKKNKDCSIPTAKRAEHRLAESFGDQPKDATSRKGSEEEVQDKMKTYLRMGKKPITTLTIQAVRELVEVNA
uniref:Uncharacterized protein n=1 Tax=Avena sativa TaxID=4498 RepID=A0ACD5TTW1_AVESA